MVSRPNKQSLALAKTPQQVAIEILSPVQSEFPESRNLPLSFLQGVSIRKRSLHMCDTGNLKGFSTDWSGSGEVGRRRLGNKYNG